MSSLEKAKQELLKCSKNYTYDDAKALLRKLGFEEKKAKVKHPVPG